MALTKEIFDSLPDEVKADYQLEGEQYVTVDSLKVVGLKTSLDSLDAKMKEGQTAAELEKEAAVAKARDEAIAEAAKKGNWEEQERLLREKFEDELKREKDGVRDEVTKEFTIKQATESLNADAKLLTKELALKPGLEPSLEALIKLRMGLDEAGNRVYKNGEGSALSVDKIDSFKAELVKDPALMGIVKGQAPSNGGFAQGGQPASGAEGQPAKSKATQGYLANLKN